MLCILTQPIGDKFIRVARKFRSKTSLFQKSRKCIRYLIEKLKFFFLTALTISHMTHWKGYNNPVCNQIPEIMQMILDIRFRRIGAVLLIVVIDIFQDISVELLLRPDKGFDPSLKCKSKVGIVLSHIQIEFLDPLRLGRKEIRVLQKFNYLYQKITVRKVNGIRSFHRLLLQILRKFQQDLQNSIPGI